MLFGVYLNIFFNNDINFLIERVLYVDSHHFNWIVGDFQIGLLLRISSVISVLQCSPNGCGHLIVRCRWWQALWTFFSCLFQYQRCLSRFEIDSFAKHAYIMHLLFVGVNSTTTYPTRYSRPWLCIRCGRTGHRLPRTIWILRRWCLLERHITNHILSHQVPVVFNNHRIKFTTWSQNTHSKF